MAWQIAGTYIENCNCDSVCPCATSGFTQAADGDACHLSLIFHIDGGEIEGVDVASRTVALVCDTPKMMADGGWAVGLFIDDGASDEQANALGAVFGGQAGGPVGALAPLIGEVRGVERAPMTYVSDGLNHSVKIGNAVDIEVHDTVHPGSDKPVELHGMTATPVPDVVVATATRSSVNAFGMEWDNTGKHGFSGPFSWSA